MSNKPILRATWRNAAVTVTARSVPRYAFTTASIDVFLAGRKILATGGVLKVIGGQVQTFEYDGQQHSIELLWGKASGVSFPIKLLFDGELILEGSVRVSNWWLVYWPLLLLIGFIVWHFH